MTTFSPVTPCFKTSPGYKGNGSCARRISYNTDHQMDNLVSLLIWAIFSISITLIWIFLFEYLVTCMQKLTNR